MKKFTNAIRYYFLLTGIVFFNFIFVNAQNLLLKEYKNNASIKWVAGSIACNTLCVSGDCDKGSLCENFSPFLASFKHLPSDSAITIRNNKIYLKDSFKKNLLGTTRETKNLRLLFNDKDRIFFYLICKPLLLSTDPVAKTTPILKLQSVPVKIGDLESNGDLFLCKVPKDFWESNSIELGIEYGKYCGKMICDVWHPYHRFYQFESKSKALKYPRIPLLLDTISAKTPESFQPKKKIILQVPFPSSKKSFGVAEVRTLINNLYEPDAELTSIIITTAPTLLEDPVKSKQQQTALANSFLQSIAANSSGNKFNSVIMHGNAWASFKEAVYTTNLYYLADSGETYVRKRLSKDPELVQKLMPVFQKLSQAKIELFIPFDPIKYPEPVYWRERMRKALANNNNMAALSFQKKLIQLCGTGEIDYTGLIPEGTSPNPYNMVLFNNQCAMMKEYALQKTTFEKLREIDPNNPVIKFNFLAIRLNEIRNAPIAIIRDSMEMLLSEFVTINNTSIPLQLYHIFESRFFYYQNLYKKDRKLISYKDIQKISKNIYADEAAKLADDFVFMGRYDIAYQILIEHELSIPAGDKELQLQYLYRLLYYGKYSNIIDKKETYTDYLTRIKTLDNILFMDLFNSHYFSWLLLADEEIRRIYLEALGEMDIE